MSGHHECRRGRTSSHRHHWRATNVNRNGDRAYVVCTRCGLFDIVKLPEGEGRWRVVV